MVAATHILRRPHRAYQLKDRLGLDTSTPAIGEVDQSAMSVACVISTNEKDRMGDVVEPSGFDLSNFAKVPAVFFDHQTLPYPIGKAQAPGGALTVRIEQTRVTAVTYFSQSLPEAVQCFHLIVEGILRGVSIGFNPLEEPERIPATDDGRPAGMHYGKIELLEYSHVGIPANPSCTVLRSLLSRGRIAGYRISPAIRKSLEPLAAPRHAQANGFTPEKSMAKRTAKKTTKKPKGVTQTDDLDPTDDDKPLPGGKPQRNPLDTGDLNPTDDDKPLPGGKPQGDPIATGDEDPTDDDIPLNHKALGEAIAPIADERDRLFFNRDSEAAHHTHAKDVEGEHLEAVRNAVEEVGVAKELTQSTDLPEGEGWYQVHPEHKEFNGEEEDEVGTEDAEPDETKKRMKVKGGMAEETPAPGTQGEDEEEVKDMPHGAAMAHHVLDYISGQKKKLEPEVLDHWKDVAETVHGHASERYPDHEFSKMDDDTGDEDAEDAADASEEEVEENEPDSPESEAETEELLDQYSREPDKKFTPKYLKRVSKAVKAVLADATEHLGSLAKMDAGEEFTGMHKAACAFHHKCMKEVCRALEGADMSGDAPDDNTEKGLDFEKISARLKQAETNIANRLAKTDREFYRATGKRLA